MWDTPSSWSPDTISENCSFLKTMDGLNETFSWFQRWQKQHSLLKLITFFCLQHVLWGLLHFDNETKLYSDPSSLYPRWQSSLIVVNINLSSIYNITLYIHVIFKVFCSMTSFTYSNYYRRQPDPETGTCSMSPCIMIQAATSRLIIYYICEN